MLKRRIDTLILVFILLCSTSFYKILGLGPLEKGSQLMGAALIFFLILFHLIYSGKRGIKTNFTWPIVFILLAMVSSMITAYVVRDQPIIKTMFAQRALYFYFLYFLLHQMRYDVRDMEKVIYLFAIIYIGLHFVQTVLYPQVLFNATVYAERGTVRIYLPGAHYITLAFLLSLQKFVQNYRLKHVMLLLLVVSVYVMRGGRMPMAILLLIIILFILFDRKVKSRLAIVFLGAIGAFAVFIIFQNIFLEMLSMTERNASQGDDYIRFRAARYFLSDFFETPISYITGNGAYHLHTAYGRLIIHLKDVYNYNLGDVGIIGNFALFGSFFILGVFAIIFRTFRLRFEAHLSFIKYYFIAVLIGLVISGNFAESDFIAMVVCLLYWVDVSQQNRIQSKEPESLKT